ncbi:MAG: S1-like domain-containing RNA-binding protein [Lachnospiraceae bacterium]|nr:S1-like domain-containing RNA-binding protein [Lachnospiraceae bacterium]
MIKIAEYQTLYLEKEVEFGVYLKEDVTEASEHVLLPKKQVPEGIKYGNGVKVFVYRDSKDRLIATTNEPKLTLHQVGRLTVSEVGKIGAFLDWGLEKELLLPFAEQTKRVKAGEEVLVAPYIDKSGRIAATMNVYPYLSTAENIKKDDRVTGTVYQTSDNFGAFVAIDDKYQGLIPQKELYGKVDIGDCVSARVISVREDGKINLSIREKAYIQIESDARTVLDIINAYDGVLPFTDKASPEVIKRETGMSKNEFKKAVGNLYKNRIIEITENNKIRLIKK